MAMYRRKFLEVLDGYRNIVMTNIFLMDHHQADSDSRACAEVLLRYMQAGVQSEQFVRMYTME